VRYEVVLIATTESEIRLVVDGEAGEDPDDVFDRAVQLLRDGDVLPGLDYGERTLSTEFGSGGVVALAEDDETEETT
jgi:hypothetical protein